MRNVSANFANLIILIVVFFCSQELCPQDLRMCLCQAVSKQVFLPNSMPRYVGFVRVFALVCGVCMCMREVPYRFPIGSLFCTSELVKSSYTSLILSACSGASDILAWGIKSSKLAPCDGRCDDVTMWRRDDVTCVQTKGCAKLVQPTQPSPCPN